ncbi:hypothetical protein [Halorussus caseinilyticus]|uniref:Uncharacterized protein n=1 Tax=Halorussus caseinilyticus TaxID=3034025 RepID=A0ABD5WE65_9EURY|nr:hypothetical protein [Halorussus sp. DT72]
MATDSESSARSERRPERNQGEASAGRQVLLEEARTTTDQQLAQINKNEVAAVRTVRLTFVLLGLLTGGSHLSSFPDLGLFGVLGMWSLVGSLVAGLFVYGTTKLFIGSRPDELSIDYTERPVSEETYVELLSRYEAGTLRNQRILYSNGFILSISRLFLASAVVLVALGLASHFPVPLQASIRS